MQIVFILPMIPSNSLNPEFFFNSYLSKDDNSFPKCVFIPVAITTPLPLPLFIILPLYSILLISLKDATLWSIIASYLSLSILSPVILLSSTFKSWEDIILKSAEIKEFSLNITMSPITSSSAVTILSTPSLRTITLVVFNLLKNSTFFLFFQLYQAVCTSPKIYTANSILKNMYFFLIINNITTAKYMRLVQLNTLSNNERFTLFLLGIVTLLSP